MESDLHQVIKENYDLTTEHYQFFLYQLLRALKYIHTCQKIYPARPASNPSTTFFLGDFVYWKLLCFA